MVVFYDERFEHLAGKIGCVLSSLNLSPGSSNVSLQRGITLQEICKRSDMEEICVNNSVVLHMKLLFNEKWIAHIITPRSDLIVPVETGKNLEPMLESFTVAMEAMAMAWGPVHILQDKSKYKSVSDIIKALKKKYVLIPTVVVLMVFCIALAASFGYLASHKKRVAVQKALQNRRAQLLADWGNETLEGDVQWKIDEPEGNDAAESLKPADQTSQISHRSGQQAKSEISILSFRTMRA
uniref:Recep_L_domain domain-containing protein n=1 Tax=Angiostrongylus cantonensis TaxID=6313 RepID=A0A0K0DQP4_ANGCA